MSEPRYNVPVVCIEFDLFVDILSRLYQCAAMGDVRYFLATRQRLCPYLLDMYSRIDGILPGGDKTGIFLRYASDPASSSECLVVIVQTTLSVKASVEREHSFDEEYWWAVPPDVRGAIIVAIEPTEADEEAEDTDAD